MKSVSLTCAIACGLGIVMTGNDLFPAEIAKQFFTLSCILMVRIWCVRCVDLHQWYIVTLYCSVKRDVTCTIIALLVVLMMNQLGPFLITISGTLIIIAAFGFHGKGRPYGRITSSKTFIIAMWAMFGGYPLLNLHPFPLYAYVTWSVFGGGTAVARFTGVVVAMLATPEQAVICIAMSQFFCVLYSCICIDEQ